MTRIIETTNGSIAQPSASLVWHGLGLDGSPTPLDQSQSPAVRSAVRPGSQTPRCAERRFSVRCPMIDARKPWHPSKRIVKDWRSGYTLVEVLVVVTITSLILTSVGVTLSSLFRVEGQLRSGGAEQAILGRLTLQLRGDAHRATAAEPLRGAESDQGFVLRLPDDATAEYRVTSRGVRRTLQRGDQREHHELFRLAQGGEARADIRREADATIVTLRIDRRSSPEPRGIVPAARQAVASTCIEAVVGLNRFLAQGGE